MARKTAAFFLALFLTASWGPAAEQRKTWVGHVRSYTGRTLASVRRQLKGWMATMRNNVASVKDGTAKGIESVHRAGRRSAASVKATTSRMWRRTYDATHDTMTSMARNFVPVGTKADARTPTVAARELASPIIEPLFLRRNDIVLAWKTSTGGRPVRRSRVLDDRFLVEDMGHELYSFDPRNGIAQWVYPLPNASQCAFGVDDNHVFVVANDTLFELDRRIGMPRRRLVFPFPVASDPAFDGDDVVVGGWDRRVYAINRKTRVKAWTYLPADTAEAGMALAPNVAYIADVSGKVIAYVPSRRRNEWEYKADDAIRVSLVMAGNDIIFPADDLFVHCVNRFGGHRGWKFPVRGSVRQQPWIDGDRCYFSAEGDAFYAIDADKGRLIWSVPHGGWPVAIGKENIYIQGPKHEIWCIDRKTGKKVWAVSAKPFTYIARNTDTDYIYLCSDAGDVYALYLRGDHIEKKAPKPTTPEKKPQVPDVEKPTEKRRKAPKKAKAVETKPAAEPEEEPKEEEKAAPAEEKPKPAEEEAKPAEEKAKPAKPTPAGVKPTKKEEAEEKPEEF